MYQMAIWNRAKGTRAAFELDGVSVSLEVAAALASLRPVRTGDDVVFCPLGNLHPRKIAIVERDGKQWAELVKA